MVSSSLRTLVLVAGGFTLQSQNHSNCVAWVMPKYLKNVAVSLCGGVHPPVTKPLQLCRMGHAEIFEERCSVPLRGVHPPAAVAITRSHSDSSWLWSSSSHRPSCCVGMEVVDPEARMWYMPNKRRSTRVRVAGLAFEAGSRQQPAGSGQQAAGSMQQAAGSRQHAAGSRQQAAGGTQQA